MTVMKTLKKLFPYNIVAVIVFFSLPLLTLPMQDTEAISTLLLFGVMKFNPSFTFFSGLLFGLRNSFRWSHAISTAVIFSISNLIYYMDAGLIYFAGMYFVCSCIGCWIGSMFKRHSDEMYL